MRRAQGCVYRPVAATKPKRRRGKFYWCKYKDADRIPQRHVLRLTNGQRITDKEVARTRLDKLLIRVQRQSVGLIDRAVETAPMSMRVVVARYVRHLRKERLSWKHIDQSRTYLKWLIEHGEIRRVADFRADKIKAALVKLDNKGLSARTVNVYRRCAHSLAAWATELDEPLMEGNPITRKRVKRRDEKADRRKTRRALTVEEAERLLAVSGPRRLFYATALWSGLRVGELRKLEWRDVLLEGDRPELQLRAEATKSKRADTLPIHPDLADLLRAAKPKGAEPADRVFRVVPILRTLTGGHQTYKTKTGEVRRFRDGDLQRAGITARDARGRSVDLHALRTTFGTWLADKGVPEHKRRVLLRHADETVTEKSYTDPRLFDLWHEIAKLPKIRKVSDAAESLRATGTDDVSSANLVGLPVGPKAVRKGVKLSQTGRKGGRRVKRTSLPGSSKTLRK